MLGRIRPPSAASPRRRRFGLVLRCTAAAAALIVAQPAPARSAGLGIDLGATLAGLFDRLDDAATSGSGGAAPGTELGNLNSVVSSLVGSNGVLATIGATLDAQGNVVEANALDIAALKVGLGELRGETTGGTGDDLSGLRATLSAHDAAIKDQDAELEAHAAALASLRGTTSMNTEMVATHDAMLNAQGASLATLRGQVAKYDAMMETAAQTQAGLAALDNRVRSSHAELSGRIDAVDRRVDTANEGVAMALALKTPTVADNKTFALSGGWGTFEGENAFAMSGAVRATDHVQIEAGIAVGADRGSVGGRAGATVSW